MKKLFSIAFVFLIILQSFSITNTDAENKTVRVGYPLFHGFSEISEDGNYRGYAYDYLSEIAKYTGWEYEMISRRPEQSGELYEMLEKGEIDMIGGTLKNEFTKDKYDFPEYSSGMNYTVLAVKNDETRFNEENYETLKGMKVAVVEGSKKRIGDLNKFCGINNIQIEILETKQSEFKQLLETGEADAVLLSDLDKLDGTRTLVKFGSQPYYFAVAKNKPEILSGLNVALAKINEIDIHFDTELYKKHFESEIKPKFSMTESEREYVSALSPLRVVSGINTIPIDYFSKDGAYQGINADFLKQISELTGLQFTYIKAESPEAAYKMIQNGEADMITNINDSGYFKTAKDLVLSSPYLEVPMVMVKRNDSLRGGGGTGILSLSDGNTLKEGLRESEPVIYNTVEECMAAVNAGKVDYTYGNSYAVEYYQKRHNWDDLALISMSFNNSLCFGIAKPFDTNLLSVFNKAVRSITDEEKQRIVFDNTLNVSYDITLTAFIKSHIIESFCILFVIIILAILWILWYREKKKSIEEKMALRYHRLSKLLDEIVFEYDFKLDKLTLSEQHAKQFSLEPENNHFLQRVRDHELYFTMEDLGVFISALQLKAQEEQEVEMKWRFPDGMEKWFKVVFILVENERGHVIYLTGKITDIDKEYAERKMLLDLSRKDSLTGLYNKLTLEVLSDECIEQKDKKTQHAFLVLDIDDFKIINDTWGHPYGDIVLRKVAERLRQTFRSTDIIGRIGGDEFAVFMNQICSEEAVHRCCKDLLRLVSDICREDKIDIFLSSSIGVALYPQHGKSYSELFKNADIAMYEQKKNKKNGYQIYNENMSLEQWKAFSGSLIESDEEQEK